VSVCKQVLHIYKVVDGKPLGTSLGHMGCYLLKQGFEVKFHIVDVEIFDRSWSKLSSGQLVHKLGERLQHISHTRYDKTAFEIIFDGYVSFIKSGGLIVLPIIDEIYLVKQLMMGPIIAIVNYNFFNNNSKYK